jgi:hypothetical protein
MRHKRNIEIHGHARNVDAGINCPTFRKQELVIKNFIEKINQAKKVQEKSQFSDEMLKETDVILSCADYKGESLDCKNCHMLTNLRKKAANLIIKAKKLAY